MLTNFPFLLVNTSSVHLIYNIPVKNLEGQRRKVLSPAYIWVQQSMNRSQFYMKNRKMMKCLSQTLVSFPLI